MAAGREGRIPNKNTGGQFGIEFFTLAGKQICAFPVKVKNGTLSLPASQLPSDIYLVVLKNNKENIVSAKFAFAR
jgi:hypothetical protein